MLQSIPPGGLVSRKPEEIDRILRQLLESRQTVRTLSEPDGTRFESRLVFIDPERRYFCVAAAANAQATVRLLARPRANLVASAPSWHYEFPAATPQLTQLGGTPVIRMAFPSLVVSQDRRRAEPRAGVDIFMRLRCLADARGIMPFEGSIVDISPRGIGFLMYQADITLEPGTVLRGCHIEPPLHMTDRTPISVDLEVRYSTAMEMPTGGYVHRSGCVILNPTRRVMELIEEFNAEARAAAVGGAD